MNKSRIIQPILLNWKFFKGDEPKAWYRGFEDSNWRNVTLPHDWSVEEPFSQSHSSGTGYLPGGMGWYRKNFALPKELEGKRVYITFEGVYNNSQVWCNSYYLGKRPYGYSSFTYDLTDFVSFGTMVNVISVKVDHKDIADSRWFTGSGIYRDVYLTITDAIHIDQYGVFITTPEVSIEHATVNHPSIILWSIGNEVDYPNDPYCHPYFQTMTGNNDANKPAVEREYDPNKPQADRLTTIAKRLVNVVKTYDTTRPVTAALAFPELANLIGYADTLDVVGYNYKEHLYEEARNKYPSRVTYGSENGASLEAWLAVRDHASICGQFIWTGIDYLGEAKGWPVRASQAGFLDLAGFKKASYFFRQSLWSQKPMLYLAAESKDNPSHAGNRRWNGGTPHWNWKKGEQVDVICYTNCEEAELFLNERSLGTKKLCDASQGYLAWEIGFEAGALKVVARGKDELICSSELITASKPEKLAMRVDDLELKADGQDIAHVEIQILDHSGTPVVLADHPIQLSIEGPGDIIGIENGNVQDVDPYSSQIRKAYQGKLLAIIRTRTEAGQIIVRADTQDLEMAQIAITVK